MNRTLEKRVSKGHGMKKMMTGMIAAALLMVGMAGAPSQASSAPYVGNVATVTTAKLLKVNKAKKAKFEVSTTAGTAQAYGSVLVKCRKGSTKLKSAPKSYAGAPIKIKSASLTAGRWSCKVKFKGATHNNSAYQASKAKKIVRVRG